MVLVLFFIIFIVFTIVLFAALSFKIDVKNLKFYKEENKKKKINADYEVAVYAYIFEKIKIYNCKLKSLQISKEYFNKFNKKIDYSVLKDFISSNAKKSNIQIIEIEKLNLNMQIGTENVILTSGFVTISNILIPILLSKFIKNYSSDKFIYKVNPIYENKNKIEFFLETTIKIKLFTVFKSLNSYSKAIKKTENRNTFIPLKNVN